MKNEDLQKIVFSKRQNGDRSTKIFRDSSEELHLKTVQRWCKVIDQTGSIDTSHSLVCLRIIQRPATMEKVKNQIKRRGKVSSQELLKELKISCTSIQSILKNDFPYKKIIEPPLIDAQRIERKRLANWIRLNFRKEQTV